MSLLFHYVFRIFGKARSRRGTIFLPEIGEGEGNFLPPRRHDAALGRWREEEEEGGGGRAYVGMRRKGTVTLPPEG